MKFVMFYSGGKDCTLALDKMLSQGHQCVALMTVMNESEKYSYMHAITKDIFEQYSESFSIPLITVKAKNKHDAEAILSALKEAKELYNAEAIVTGDIDCPNVKKFNENIAKMAGLEIFIPLWDKPRQEVLDEILQKGYQCMIKVVDKTLLPTDLLGKILDKDMIEIFKKNNIDICGENGEYHSLVINGPIFKKEIVYQKQEMYCIRNQYCGI